MGELRNRSWGSHWPIALCETRSHWESCHMWVWVIDKLIANLFFIFLLGGNKLQGLRNVLCGTAMFIVFNIMYTICKGTQQIILSLINGVSNCYPCDTICLHKSLFGRRKKYVFYCIECENEEWDKEWGGNSRLIHHM